MKIKKISPELTQLIREINEINGMEQTPENGQHFNDLWDKLFEAVIKNSQHFTIDEEI
jgi:hypothetical protein